MSVFHSLSSTFLKRILSYDFLYSIYMLIYCSLQPMPFILVDGFHLFWSQICYTHVSMLTNTHLDIISSVPDAGYSYIETNVLALQFLIWDEDFLKKILLQHNYPLKHYQFSVTDSRTLDTMFPFILTYSVVLTELILE
jgi:hypothetical protein